jgi:D-psicose/D-tagatose/L-ribulose 3-epimerase
VWTSPLTDERLADLAPRVRDWGFDVIELPVEQPGDWDPSRAADLLATLGLGATVTLAMGDGRELVATDAATVATTQDYLRHVVDVAATIGATAIGGPAYASVGRCWTMDPAERSAAYAELVTSLRPVVDYAGSRGVRIGVEPLNRYETSVLNTVEQALEAIDPLPAEACGLMLDAFHMNIEETDLAAAIRTARGRIVHVQVAGSHRGTPGADHIDWAAFFGALDEVGYDGPVCIESFTRDNATIARAASIWRPLAPTQDALATDGLAFLRQF